MCSSTAGILRARSKHAGSSSASERTRSGRAWAALGYGGLGVLAALVGGYLPARWAQGMAPAQVLKGLGQTDATRHLSWLGPVLLLLGAGLAQLPPGGKGH